MLKPHARRRLRERHGILLTGTDFVKIGQRLALATYRDDPRLYRFISESRDDSSLWQANLEPYTGRETWVVIAWEKPKQRVRTVLAVPANLTAEAVKGFLETKNDRVSQGYGQRGPNQTPRDRRERKRA